MPTPGDIEALIDLGGYGLFAFGLVIAIVSLYKGWIVPAWIASEWKAERDAARAESAADRKTVERLTLQLARERRHRASDPPDD